MHKEVKQFCKSVKKRFPKPFRGEILDVGSLDINGNNRYLRGFFGHYTGLDIVKGNNVDVVMPVVKFNIEVMGDNKYDAVVSTEMLEHDRMWEDSLRAMYHLVRKGGLLLITCAAPGRPEHGTTRTTPQCSPATNDYYRNVSINDFSRVLTPNLFKEYYLTQKGTDLQFYGIKAL